MKGLTKTIITTALLIANLYPFSKYAHATTFNESLSKSVLNYRIGNKTEPNTSSKGPIDHYLLELQYQKLQKVIPSPESHFISHNIKNEIHDICNEEESKLDTIIEDKSEKIAKKIIEELSITFINEKDQISHIKSALVFTINKINNNCKENNKHFNLVKLSENEIKRQKTEFIKHLNQVELVLREAYSLSKEIDIQSDLTKKATDFLNSKDTNESIKKVQTVSEALNKINTSRILDTDNTKALEETADTLKETINILIPNKEDQNNTIKSIENSIESIKHINKILSSGENKIELLKEYIGKNEKKSLETYTLLEHYFTNKDGESSAGETFIKITEIYKNELSRDARRVVSIASNIQSIAQVTDNFSSGFSYKDNAASLNPIIFEVSKAAFNVQPGSNEEKAMNLALGLGASYATGNPMMALGALSGLSNSSNTDPNMTRFIEIMNKLEVMDEKLDGIIKTQEEILDKLDTVEESIQSLKRDIKALSQQTNDAKNDVIDEILANRAILIEGINSSLGRDICWDTFKNIFGGDYSRNLPYLNFKDGEITFSGDQPVFSDYGMLLISNIEEKNNLQQKSFYKDCRSLVASIKSSATVDKHQANILLSATDSQLNSQRLVKYNSYFKGSIMELEHVIRKGCTRTICLEAHQRLINILTTDTTNNKLKCKDQHFLSYAYYNRKSGNPINCEKRPKESYLDKTYINWLSNNIKNKLAPISVNAALQSIILNLHYLSLEVHIYNKEKRTSWEESLLSTFNIKERIKALRDFQMLLGTLRTEIYATSDDFFGNTLYKNIIDNEEITNTKIIRVSSKPNAFKSLILNSCTPKPCKKDFTWKDDNPNSWFTENKNFSRFLKENFSEVRLENKELTYKTKQGSETSIKFSEQEILISKSKTESIYNSIDVLQTLLSSAINHLGRLTPNT